MNYLVKNFLKNGIVKGTSELLSKNEMKELEKLILISRVKHLKDGEVSQNIIGIDKRIDQLLEKILINSEVKSILSEILGENYLIRQIFARYNTPDDKGLTLHQDAIGEAGLMILVNDQPDGSTVFFPGSQLIPSKKHLAQMVSWNSLKLINLTKYFLTPAAGNAGAHFFFLHRTWHGRTPGKSNETKISIFFDMFPVSARRKDYLYESEYNSMINWEFVEPPNLKKMISRRNYTAAVETFEKSAHPLSSLTMKASSFDQIMKNKIFFLFTILKLILLEFLFLPIRLKRLFSNLLKKKT